MLSGENLKAGHVLGRKLVAPTVAAARACAERTAHRCACGQVAVSRPIEVTSVRGVHKGVRSAPSKNHAWR